MSRRGKQLGLNSPCNKVQGKGRNRRKSEPAACCSSASESPTVEPQTCPTEQVDLTNASASTSTADNEYTLAEPPSHQICSFEAASVDVAKTVLFDEMAEVSKGNTQLTPTKLAPEASPLDPQSDVTKSMLMDEIAALRAERDAALQKCDEAVTALNTVKLSSGTVSDNNEKCMYYTGLSWPIFVATFQQLLSCSKFKGIPCVPYIDQFFYMLVKLKHGMRFEYLADQAGIPQSTLIDHFWKWIEITYAKLGFLVKWPDREYIFHTIPPAFKFLYPRLTCLIDCFEVFIEAPGNLKARALTWSNYIKDTTMKFLIGCTPLGAISFLSDAWGGRVSDVELVHQSGFLTKCEHFPGDQILADRGFTMKEDFARIAGIELHTPAFLKGQDQMPAKDLETSRRLSSVRIHVERVIGLMKNRFAILQGTIPLRVVKSLKDEAENASKSSADKIVGVCAILTNLGGGIVYKE